MELNKKQAVLFASVSVMFCSVASANPPNPNVYDGGNKWRITFYIDSTNNHDQWATQEICFLPYVVVGNSIQGAWYSTSFPDWNGRYYQEGDEVKMTGDYANDVGHDHMTLFHTTYDVPGKVRGIAFKDWTEWREDGLFGNIIGWGNTQLVRAGKCDIPHTYDFTGKFTIEDIKFLESEAQEISLSLPDRLTVEGRVATYPGQPNLENIEEYLSRSGVK